MVCTWLMENTRGRQLKPQMAFVVIPRCMPSALSACCCCCCLRKPGPCTTHPHPTKTEEEEADSRQLTPCAMRHDVMMCHVQCTVRRPRPAVILSARTGNQQPTGQSMAITITNAIDGRPMCALYRPGLREPGDKVAWIETPSLLKNCRYRISRLAHPRRTSHL
jgi:hypothetical protein